MWLLEKHCRGAVPFRSREGQDSVSSFWSASMNIGMIIDSACLVLVNQPILKRGAALESMINQCLNLLLTSSGIG